jgi:hypothetical protein
MSNKHINYLSRDFEAVKSELLKFSNQYYPEVFDDFNDSSIGAWFIDMVSAIGDDLNYHIDRTFQETNIDSANLRSTVLNLARTNGFKVPGRKASMCEIEVSCVLPTDTTDISSPDWRYAPILQRTSIVSAGNNNFQLTEDVNFAEQFNSDGYSNRTIVPSRNGNGDVTGYTITKSTIAVNGNSKVYRKVLSASDVKPFMEIVLPEDNVLEVESVIFKETSDYSTSPNVYEYFIDAEEYRISSDAVMTYRFFECDSLADQWRFGDVVNYSNYIVDDIRKPHKYVDYTEGDKETTRATRYYVGEWKPLRQKFITEFTDNGYIKLIFGSGIKYDEVPKKQTKYADYIASKLINNDMLGVLPNEGWTMFVRYRVGGGISTNLGPGAINKISLANIDWGGNIADTNGTLRGNVITSMKVTNISTALAGKDEPSVAELKNLIKYNTSAQNRAVTVKDYKVKLMQMQPRYGAPFRNCVLETNNKIEMDFLGMNANGKLDSSLPETLVTNVIKYMSHYKQINDYIEIKSGRIYNIGVSVDAFIDKNYNPGNVVKNIIDTVTDYFDVNKHDMGEDIFVGDLEKEITLVDGVISLIGIKIYKIWNGSYSPDKCPLPTVIDGAGCEPVSSSPFILEDRNAMSEQIDLDAIDHVLLSDYNSLFEIRQPSIDIQVSIKSR